LKVYEQSGGGRIPEKKKEKGKAGNIARSSVRNWMKKTYPEVFSSIKEEVKVLKAQEKLEKAQKTRVYSS